MIRLSAYLFPVLLFFACSGEKDNDVVNINEIMPHAKRTSNPRDTSASTPTITGFDLEVAQQIGWKFSAVAQTEAPLFPDRFYPKNSHKLTLFTPTDSTFFCQWAFKDSTATNNAFYNWLDCFGASCKSIKVNENINFQRDNFILLLNDTSITYITSPAPINTEQWLHYFELKNELNNWKTIIQQGRKKKATWSTMIDGEIHDKNKPIPPALHTLNSKQQ